MLGVENRGGASKSAFCDQHLLPPETPILSGDAVIGGDVHRKG